MPTSAHVRTSDLRAVFHLAGECRDLGDDVQDWWPHWYAGLAGLAGAGLAVGGEAIVVPGGQILATGTAAWGWENGFDQAVMVRALAECGAELTVAPHLARYQELLSPGGGPVLARTDLVADTAFFRSPYYEAIHRPMGLGHCLISFRAVAGVRGEYSAVTLSRAAGDRRDFTARQKAIVQEAHAVVAPLVGGPLARFADPSPAALALRVRQVLWCLLQGDSDKQIVKRLGISPHTVNQYTKTIYAHFGCQSRPELLARWVKRGWENGFAWVGPPG